MDDASRDVLGGIAGSPTEQDPLQQRRGAILEVICHSAQRLTEAFSPLEVLPALVPHLAEVLEVDHVLLERYEDRLDGEVLAHPLIRWSRPHLVPPSEMPRSAPVALRAAGLGELLERFLQGEPVQGPPEGFPEPAAQLMRAWGARTTLCLPLLARARLIGLLALVRCRNPEAWPEGIVLPLRVLGALIGSSLLRQEHEDALRESEERHRQVAEAISEYIWETDTEGVLTYVSERVEAITGYQPEELVGRYSYEMLAIEDVERIRSLFLELAAERRPCRGVVIRLRHKSGSVLYAELSGVPLLDADGGLVGYRGAVADVTQRTLADEALRTSEERYRGLVETQRALICRFDPEFRLTFCNQAYADFFGHVREAAIGSRVLDHVPPERRDSVRRLLQLLSKPPHHVVHHEELLSADGPRWLAWESFPVRDASGHLIEVQAVGRDVTEARQVEVEIQRRDRILAAVNAAAEHILKATDWTTAVRELSELIGRATGVNRVGLWQVEESPDGCEELVRRGGWADSEAEHPDPAAESIRIKVDDLGPRIEDLRQGRPLRVTAEEIPSDVPKEIAGWGLRTVLAVPIQTGGMWWGALALSYTYSTPQQWSAPIVDALRAAASLIGGLIGRNRIDQSLRESEEKYRSLVEGAAQPIVMIDRHGVIQFANQVAAGSFGLSPEEIVGKSHFDLFPPELAAQHAQAVRDALDRGSLVVRQRRTLVGGQWHWYEARIQPLKNVRGGQEVALLILDDITDQRRAKRRVLDYQRRLRQLSTELTRTEQRERRRIAAELHDRIGQSLAMARIRLPSVLRESEPAEQAKVLEEVKQLLDQTIDDTRTLTFELSPPILYELGLDPALEWLLERVERQHGLVTRFVTDGKPKEPAGDLLGFLFQAAQELLVNVAKHAEACTVRVRSTLRRGRIYIEVLDDGCGFEPQARGIASNPRGFGLFSLRERLRHLGGALQVTSKPGRGARVVFWVPLSPESNDREEEDQIWDPGF